MRWAVRGLGFISTLILARLLTPEDFGIVAMSTVVAGLANVLFEFGVATVLIQDPDPTKEDYDTAWSIRLLQAILAAASLVIIAPYAVDYFNEPRIKEVLWIVALATAVGGFENIGVVKFQKTLDFKSDFQFEISRKLIQFMMTLVLAFTFRSYWALVFGILCGRLSGVAISYLIHPYRPRWDLSAFTKIWSFSRWILLLRVGAYARNEVDKIVIGARGDTSLIGKYFLASEIAHMISTEILAPINRAVFPALSKLNQHQEAMRKALHLALGAQATVTFPIAVGLSLVADDIVPLLLGDQWVDIIPIMQILALIGVPLCIRYNFSSALTALRKLTFITLLVWLEIAAFLTSVFFIMNDPSVIDIAIIKAILSLIVSISLISYVSFIKITDLVSIVSVLWRPALSVIGMASVIIIIKPYLTGIHAIDLLSQLFVGSSFYIFMITVSWFVVGRPDSIESLALRRFGWFGQTEPLP